MAGEIHTLETKVATLMQQQTSQHQRTPDLSLGDGVGGIGQSEERIGRLDMESVRGLLKTTSDGVKKDVISLVSTTSN